MENIYKFLYKNRNIYKLLIINKITQAIRINTKIFTCSSALGRSFTQCKLKYKTHICFSLMCIIN